MKLRNMNTLLMRLLQRVGVVLFLILTTTATFPMDVETCVDDDISSGTHYYDCNGLDFTLSVPNGCENGGCGLIADVHGLTMDDDIQNAGTDMRRLGRKAMERGAATPYLVVQPSANGFIPSWSEDDDDDVYDFMQQVVDAWDIDENRIHMGGFSQGGAMSYRFLCKYNDFIASFAPIADEVKDCALPKNPVLHIHGYADPLIPYYTAVNDTRDTFTALMGDYTKVYLNEGLLHTHRRYSGNGYKWELIAHDSVGVTAGHCIAGGFGLYGCPISSFDTGKATIDFYIANPK